MKKRCPGCSRNLPTSDYYRNRAQPSGLDTYCKNCKKKIMREYYKANAERVCLRVGRHYAANRDKVCETVRNYRRDNPQKIKDKHRAWERAFPEKKKAQHALWYATQQGVISRQPCEVCGITEGVEAHHDDYSKPLEVRWLCRSHHRRLHGKMKRDARRAV